MPTTADLDNSLNKVHDSQQARLIRNFTEDWILGHEEDALVRSINQYREGTLTETQAICTIAELSGLRAFKETLQSKIRIGVMEAELELGE
jgi:hypothetical protein